VYSTTSPLAISTAFFGWLYVAVVAVPFAKFVTSTDGSLPINVVPFFPDINFLNAKSNSWIITFSKSSSSSCPGIYSLPEFISSSLYVGKSVSAGNVKFPFGTESLSVTAPPLLSVSCVIWAKFVIFFNGSVEFFTLHFTLTSL